MTQGEDSPRKAYVDARVRFFRYEDGGRPQMPIGSGYAPYIRSQSLQQDLAVRVNNVPAGAELDSEVQVELELSWFPRFNYDALKKGVKFVLVEGPKVVAEGVCCSDLRIA